MSLDNGGLKCFGVLGQEPGALLIICTIVKEQKSKKGNYAHKVDLNYQAAVGKCVYLSYRSIE